MERILVDKDQQLYKRRDLQFNIVKNLLQEICDALKQNKIQPTTDRIQMLLDGEDLMDIYLEEHLKSCRNLPVTIQNIVKEEARQELEKIRAMAAKVMNKMRDFEDGLLDLSVYSVDEAGNIQLDPGYIAQVEKISCVFVDTPARKILYDKAQAVIQAIKELNQACKEAPYRDLRPAERGIIDDLTLQGMTRERGHSLIFLGEGYEPKLNGWCFSYIK